MVRCDYDALFYRVFCITLLALALTFTVILTNVFVDIDGLILKKEAGDPTTEMGVRDQITETSEYPSYDGVVYDYTDDSYRTKRSLDNSNFNLKRILAQKLANLVEEFDREEPVTVAATEKTTRNLNDILSNQIIKDTERDRTKEIFHTALHNLLLNGIIHHMDLRDVYNHALILADTLKIENIGLNSIDPELRHTNPKVEELFLKELVNCVALHKEVAERSKRTEEDEKLTTKHSLNNPKVMIKTIIDITSAEKQIHQNDINPKQNINGVVKLIYNGKNVRIANLLDDTTSKNEEKHSVSKTTAVLTTTEATTPIQTAKEPFDTSRIPKSFMDKFVQEYFQRFETNKTNTEKPQLKRIKRHSIIRYENKDVNKTKKKDDEELYVEIETHFDGKGLKGEKKKKLISGLVKKIEDAIHSNKVEAKRRKHKHVHVKKRLQNPLEQSKVLWMKKISSPVSSIIHREVSPILNLLPDYSIILDTTDKSRDDSKKTYLEYITDKSGESWKLPPMGPGFLNTAKSLNSAEKGEVEIDYNRVLSSNGIPQRLQKPLNTEDSDEDLSNVFQDIGNLKFLIKDDGAGLSIGFNQYADEPPDTETIKLFTDLKNIVNTYHQSYDDDSDVPLDINVAYKPKHAKDIGSDHTIMRRSISNEHDNLSDGYKVIYRHEYLPKDKYIEVLMKSNNIKAPENNIYSTLTLGDNKLKPVEIIKLANLLLRKKRSMKLNKLTNTRTKMKLSKFLNTGTLKKRIFINKKRSKRQINKIRIIASDIPNMPRESNENIYLTADDKIFANRAIVREFNHGINNDHRRKQEDSEELPFYEGSLNAPNIFGSKSRHNALTSRYPHILLKEIGRSKEEPHDNALLFSNIYQHDDFERNDKVTTGLVTENGTENYSQLMKFFDSVMPTKYKLSVKLIPKNGTDLHGGFKEVHTSINKSFNKNGLLFSSLVNVSEISKITNVNKTDNSTEDIEVIKDRNSIQEQQLKMQSLLDQHKKHIDEQLKQLRQERANLDRILVHTNNIKNKTHYLDVVIPDNPRRALVALSTTVRPVTTESVTVTTIKVTDKPNITSNLIEMTERLTQQVLNKIDQNTKLLQEFLLKLTAHFTPATPKPNIEEPVKVELPKEWKPHPLAVTKFEPTNLSHKNESHLAIPFVYAYQRPISSNRGSKSNDLASIVYHGHIHTNTILNNEFKKETENVNNVKASDGNQTRFFIDNLVGSNKT